jgi:hypothetical protein
MSEKVRFHIWMTFGGSCEASHPLVIHYLAKMLNLPNNMIYID